MEIRELLIDLMKQFDNEQRAEEANTILLTMETAMQEHLTVQPRDTEIWFKLGLLHNYCEDQIASIECMDKILSYDPQNGYARIMSAIFMSIISVIDEVQFAKLDNFVSDDNEINSMIEYTKSIYYLVYGNDEMEEQVLKKSVLWSDKHAKNHADLAYIYMKKGDYKEACRLSLIALSNIKSICNQPCCYDFLDIDRFLDAYVTGMRPTLNSYGFTLYTLKMTLNKMNILKGTSNDQ
ncbi:MAG: hypothetical protein WCE21_00770 [Candidatus Babeliales bacterium]